MLTYDFKSDAILYQVGTFVFPLNFTRLKLSIDTFGIENNLHRESEALIFVRTENVNRNIEIYFVRI